MEIDRSETIAPIVSLNSSCFDIKGLYTMNITENDFFLKDVFQCGVFFLVF